MKIRNYRCTNCGCKEFFLGEPKGNNTPIYCKGCGKWLKWADKNEKNLAQLQK